VELDTAVGAVMVGSMICADREYPETPRMLAEMGAEVLLVSNACDLTDWHLAMFRTRAFENAVAVAMANYGAPACNGRSPAYGADGAELAEGPLGNETIVCVSLQIPCFYQFQERTV
jgi:predicted amidohydrolase